MTVLCTEAVTVFLAIGVIQGRKLRRSEQTVLIDAVQNSLFALGCLHYLSKQTVCTPIGVKQCLLGEIPKTLYKKTTPKN